MKTYLTSGSRQFVISKVFESEGKGERLVLDNPFSAESFLKELIFDWSNMAALREAFKDQFNDNLTLLSDSEVIERVAGLISAGFMEVHQLPSARWGDAASKGKGKEKPTEPPEPKQPPKPAPPPPEKKEEQKFKLVEIVEVVKRPGLGCVAGAAPASKSAQMPKLLDRADKDGSDYKQYINLKKDIEGASKRRPDHDRYIELRARVEWVSGDKTKSLAGKQVHWSYKITPQSGAKRPANLNGTQNPGFSSANGAKTLKTATDKDGWTSTVQFHLSQYAGDKFEVHAQADVDEKGSPSGDKLKAGPYVVWRKFWYQTTHAHGKAVSAPDKSVAAYKLVAADMLKSDTVTFKKADVANSDRCFYPRWMVAGGNDDTDEVVIGGHNRTWFYNKFNNEVKRPVKGHLILCDHQWDPAPSAAGVFSFPVDSRNKEVTLNLGSWNAGILKPALKGNLVTYGKWTVKESGAFTEFFRKIGVALKIVDPIKREGNLTDANIKIEKGRSGLNALKVALPADCPDPKKYPVTVHLKINYGKYYAGESNVHQMLIVYRAGEDKKFNQVVSHEFGHGFGQAPRPGKQPAGLANHPKQYTNEHGGVGSHCSTDATLGAATTGAPSGLYKDGTCIMFHQVNPSGCKQKFCDDCDPYLRLWNMDKLR